MQDLTRPLPALLAALLMMACAPLPDFGAFPEASADGSPAPPPGLLPLDQILAQASAPSVAQPRAHGLAARAARLRARAALMRGPVNEPATRSRLIAAITEGRA